jgi:hypothetical protein
MLYKFENDSGQLSFWIGVFAPPLTVTSLEAVGKKRKEGILVIWKLLNVQ